jgi:hypothetical protein
MNIGYRYECSRARLGPAPGHRRANPHTTKKGPIPSAYHKGRPPWRPEMDRGRESFYII